MIFEYIRPIDPSPAQSGTELEPVRFSDAQDLDDLLSLATFQGGEETTPLACPELLGQRVELPRFAGISLADVVLETVPAPSRERQQTPPLSASLPPKPRTLLGPGAMTMTLAVVATLVLGVAVAAQAY
jgi:hypothetical protein